MAGGRIFLSYRRSDEPGYAGRIYDRLDKHFPGRVFRDVEGIAPGVEFARVIADRIQRCRAIVVVIGPRWAGPEGGPSRIHEESDWVRLEIREAVRRKLAVFPVLVNGARLPSRGSLPDDIVALCDRQAIELHEHAFEYSVEQLAASLGTAIGERPATLQRTRSSSSRAWALVGALAVFFVGVVVALVLIPRPSSTERIVEVPVPVEVTPEPEPAAPARPTPSPQPAPVAQRPAPVAPTPEPPASVPTHLGFTPAGTWRFANPQLGGNLMFVRFRPDRTMDVLDPMNGTTVVTSGRWTLDQNANQLILHTNDGNSWFDLQGPHFDHVDALFSAPGFDFVPMALYRVR